jgi:S1-C subfamily serine protease
MMRSVHFKMLGRLILVAVALGLAGLACNALPDEEPTATSPADIPVLEPTPKSSQVDESPEPTQPSGQESVGSGNAELAKATVQIFALYTEVGEWDVIWTGSGSIVSSDGLILTNAHVVDDRYDEYSVLGIATTDRTDEPPELVYLAEIEAVDYGLDLAVIRIVSDLDGNSVDLNLPWVELGDSDVIEIGGKLRILGYPGIGGDTITFTEGAVSGFTQERSVEGRAWIKTDATIAGGNSGGMAANEAGQLIGVPTRASGGSDNQIVDCRPVADTNRDGYVDDLDTCVPIGGFINGLRPVNLALPLIEAAMSGQSYVGGPQPGAAPSGGYDTSETFLYDLAFSDGVTDDDQPTQLWWALPSGVTEICAFWDYEGMVDGMIWSAYWFANGELSEGGSFINDIWEGGESGSWWVCIFNDNGLDDGLYELVLEVEGQSMTNESIFVGGGRSVVDFIVINDSSFTICYVNLSPSEAQNWGQDELASDEVIQSGFEAPLPLPTGVYDVRLRDCELEPLLTEYGIEVFEDTEYTISDS